MLGISCEAISYWFNRANCKHISLSATGTCPPGSDGPELELDNPQYTADTSASNACGCLLGVLLLLSILRISPHPSFAQKGKVLEMDFRRSTFPYAEFPIWAITFLVNNISAMF